MLAKCLVFVFLLVFVYSHITIRIRPGIGGDTVQFFGIEREVISDQEIKTFKLNESTLIKASENFQFGPCDYIRVKPPTVQGDVWERNDWDIVQRILKPVRARALGISSKPVAMASAEYVNDQKNDSAIFSTTVSEQVEESVSHTWSEEGKLSVTPKIIYEVDYGMETVVGATSLLYTSNWNEDTTTSRTVTISTTSSVFVTIPPGGRVIATLTATQGTMDIEVVYEAFVEGDVYCRFKDPKEGSRNWAYDVIKLQNSGNLPKVIRSTERLSITFYSDARIEVVDGSTHDVIEMERAAFTKVGNETKS